MVPKETRSRDGALVTLEPDQKHLLLRSIGQYVDRSGFSKTLKKFLSEAEIEKNDLGGPSIDLEEIFSKHLECGGDLRKENAEVLKDMADGSADTAEANGNKKKKKKQKTGESDGQTDLNPEASKENATVAASDEMKKKKDKKKKSKDLKFVETEDKDNNGSSEMEDKLKDRKKKKRRMESDSPDEDVEVSKKESEKGNDEPKSKKRKSREIDTIKDGNESMEIDEADKVSKKQKKAVENSVDGPENGGLEKTPGKQQDAPENGSLEKSGGRSANQKSGMTGSKEPKKPFQRVKVEEVVFNDERLQDNSYWAKDGAEIGYGAKAQEILGQVRGRDFRHEKTKKKRGSYRGGLIDLQSHSVKFNDSDEE